MNDNIYLINWNMFFFQKKNNYEFLDLITKEIKNIDFPDDINNTKLLSLINNSNNKKFIFPFQIPGKDHINLYNFIYKILNKLLNMDLKNNTFYFFTNDPFYLGETTDFGKQANRILNLLYTQKGKQLKVICPLFSLDNVKFSNKNENGCFPLVKNYDNVLFFPYIHYCYKLAKMTLNVNPIKQVLLSGAVGKAYPERLKLRNVFNRNNNHKYIAKYTRDCAGREAEMKSDSNIYNIKLNQYLLSFYSGVYNLNGNFIMLKLYEILGAGCLLLVDKKSKNVCDKVGLIENVHYLSINMDDNETNIINRIKSILHDNNQNYISNIRNRGMNFCHKYLDYKFTKNKFLDFVKKNIYTKYKEEMTSELEIIKQQILNEIKNGYSLELLNIKIIDNVYKSCHNQIHILYDLRNLIKKEKCVYVEIGAWLGDSASLLLLNKHNTDIYCIDLFYNNNVPEIIYQDPNMYINNFKTQEEVLKIRLNKNNLYNKKIEILKGQSDDSNIIKRISKLSIDILFIDGCHNYQNVIDDFVNYEKYVEKGGFIVFDDYQDKKYCPDVKKAIDYIVSNLDVSKYLIVGSLERQFKYNNWASEHSKYSTEFILYKK